jgi:anti-sigma factor RsiW
MSAAAVSAGCCAEWEAGAVTEHMEGALDAGERLRWDVHLAICPRCARLLAEMNAVRRLLGSLRE